MSERKPNDFWPYNAFAKYSGLVCPDCAKLEARIKRLREALRFECGNRCHVDHNPCNAREALAADDAERSEG